MRAITHDVYGNSEVLHMSDVPVPSHSNKEVLVKVKSAGLHKGNWHLMTGIPYIVRLAFGFSRPSNKVMGSDISGVIDKVGGNVTTFKVGDEVFGTTKGDQGGWAELCVCDPNQLTIKPPSINWNDAGAVPTSAVTALEALRDVGNVKPGQKVLIIGASGGVGIYAVQLAKHTFSCEVTGVCSGAKADMVRTLGADYVIDYAQGPDVTTLGKSYDLILDIAGDRTVSSMRKILTPDGTLVLVGGEGGNKIAPFGRMIYMSLANRFVKHNLKVFMSVVTTALMEFIKGEMEAGRLKAHVGREYSFEDARKAMADHEEGKLAGKAAILIGAEEKKAMADHEEGKLAGKAAILIGAEEKKAMADHEEGKLAGKAAILIGAE
eukprot:CAMPEP_0173415562 /NCGR_PEP_ID=MMETSP1356-20130122/84925_1 /TAXON_ID=77927 ORGANISM="Hemiselmis virescens, Strain PCC157" /NCGR_SAMPLE_ID=MMETSP1356 /ASSEMBLY_ACC=CAM_ASM_000847 /LENGTH=377 /DNA_ID=CAMNT_0014377813 /DNA_START=121 /DNA_END=1256 /DNA_ORIENTATION=-